MDVFNLYLSTFRYIMNANPDDKSSWCDIFKYIPYLRHMLSCCVCGGLLLDPHGVAGHGLCPHHVCRRCLGGRMRVRPSCTLCRDHSLFHENKKLRVLMMCFKRLCAYISHSSLGVEISKASINGFGYEAERTITVLEEAELFQDDFIFTPPPTKFPHIAKSASRRLKPLHSSNSGLREHTFTQPCKRKRGRPKSVPKLSMRSGNLNISKRVKKLKKMALNSATKRSFVKKLLPHKRLERKQRPIPDTSGLLISQRPHRDKSGKSSIGQLWRETFLEEVQPDSYPDSGIEVGNSPDHDHYTNTSQSTKLASGKVDPVVKKPESFRKETRLHKHSEADNKDTSVKDVTSTADNIQKPRLTLTISKERYQTLPRKGRSVSSTTSSRYKDMSLPLGRKPAFNLAHTNLSSRLKKASLGSNPTGSAIHLRNICKCTRLLQPNNLTCFGQKCPCYTGRRPCIDCLCNGCKNPVKTSDFAPPLTHIKEADGLDHSFDRSMPRLSPIPRI